MTNDVGPAMDRLHKVLTRLRTDCPWDREQTHTTLVRHAREEAEELAQALAAVDEAAAEIDATPDGSTQQRLARVDHAMAVDNLVEELGDLLLQVVLNAVIGEQAGSFTLAEVLHTIEEKMVRRHPHVFERSPDLPELTEAELSEQWRRIKQGERDAKQRRRHDLLEQF